MSKFGFDARVKAGMIAGGLLAAAFAGPAGAEIYRWVDAAGVVNYSNVKPDVKSEVVPDRLIVVKTVKPSAEEIRALDERLAERRAQAQQAEASAARYPAPIIVSGSTGSAPGYYAVGGGIAHSTGFDLGIPEDKITTTSTTNTPDGQVTTEWVQRHPHYELRPGIGGVGGQIVPLPAPQRPAFMGSR